jgi:hypothetical protein
MTTKITCRKCGGPHLTIKCDKNNALSTKSSYSNNEKNKTQNLSVNIPTVILKEEPIEKNKFFPQQTSGNYNKNYKSYKNKNYNYNLKIYRVKIVDLPNDITEDEMKILLYNWGDISRIKVFNYSENSIVLIDFKIEEQADYFVKALHKTVFEHAIIAVTRIEQIELNNSKVVR